MQRGHESNIKQAGIFSREQKNQLNQWFIGAERPVLYKSAVAIATIDAIAAIKSEINERMAKATAAITGNLIGVIGNRDDFWRGRWVSGHYVNSCELYIYPRFIDWISRKTNGEIQWPHL